MRLTLTTFQVAIALLYVPLTMMFDLLLWSTDLRLW
jgi:hypothetical protein